VSYQRSTLLLVDVHALVAPMTAAAAWPRALEVDAVSVALRTQVNLATIASLHEVAVTELALPDQKSLDLVPRQLRLSSGFDYAFDAVFELPSHGPREELLARRAMASGCQSVVIASSILDDEDRRTRTRAVLAARLAGAQRAILVGAGTGMTSSDWRLIERFVVSESSPHPPPEWAAGDDRDDAF